MNLKASKYNILIRHTDKNFFYLWNSKSGAIVEFEEPLYMALQNNKLSDAILSPYIEELVKQGILVNKNIDEYYELVERAKRQQYSCDDKTFSLVIVPTLACNYHCVYCFERGRTDAMRIMDASTAEKLINFIRTKIVSSNIKRLNIHWFGGEPLLAYEQVVNPVSTMIFEFCKLHKVEYACKITTNGYFLSEDKFNDIIKKFHTEQIQVTFDGTETEYCRKKGVTPKEYRTSKNNVLELAEYIKKFNYPTEIAIRLNADKANYADLLEFVREIKSDSRFNEKIHFYLGRLKNYVGEAVECFSLEEYKDKVLEFNRFVGKGYTIPQSKSLWCLECSSACYGIGPRGEIYKCEHDFGLPECEVGHLDYGLSYNAYYNEFTTFFKDEKCKKCKLFPICLGGCPKERIINKTLSYCEVSLDYVKKLVWGYIINSGQYNT